MLLFFFFFQAEDGIRDGRVTGVQTCALPISPLRPACRICAPTTGPPRSVWRAGRNGGRNGAEARSRGPRGRGAGPSARSGEGRGGEKGRIWGGAGSLKKKEKRKEDEAESRTL